MLIYDADCGFCTKSATWIERRLPDGSSIVSWQSVPDLGKFGLTMADVTAAAWWIEPHGERVGGHLAIGAALRACGGFWGLVGRALLIPPGRWLGGPIYRLIARNRYRLPGSSDACRIDTQP